MKYETDEYIINYNECDKEYIEEFIKYFEQEKERIFKFFNIDKFNKKLIIKLYDTVDKYAEYRKYQLSESSVGNMSYDDNYYFIHMLSYKPLITRKGHTNKQLQDFFKLLVHEFVHVCHKEKGDIRNSLVWIREGIAILLSKQKYELKELDCSLEDLLNNNQVLYNNYYSLMDYTLNTYGNEYVKKLVVDSDFGKEETEKIYNEYNNKFYILNSPDSLNYITDQLDDILPNKIDKYKKIFKIDSLEPIKINYFDDIDKFRSFIYDIRGRKDTLPSYAVGTYDKGMINAYIDPNIIVDSPKYRKKLYLPCHELFHILYMKYILKNDYSKRIVWYDEGMAQFLSGEKNELLNEEKFNLYFNKVKDNTKIIPELNNLEHGNSFSNDNYDGYALSYLSIRYLNEILEEQEFYDLMGNFDQIKKYGNTIVQDMFNYYIDKYNSKVK